MTENVFSQLPVSRDQLENEKFTLDSENKVAIRTKTTGTLTGELTPSGLTIGGRFTEVTLTDTGWTALQAIGGPLADRNAIAIQNESGVDIKVQFDSGLASYKGMTIRDKSERQYDITDSIIIYGRSASGTITVNVEEIA